MKTVSLLVLALIVAAPAQAAKPKAKPAPATPAAPKAPLPELLPDGRPKLGVAEGQQLFEANGYRIGDGTALNLCGRPAKPQFVFKDLNGDKFPEVIGTDTDAACYGGAFVTVAYRQPNGVWAWVFRARGTATFGSKTTNGWLDMTVQTKCATSYVFNGTGYVQNGVCVADGAPSALPTPVDFDQAFQAAGMVKKNGHWTGCPDDDNGYAQVENGDYRDINQDGVNDLVISDYGGYCYGDTGQGFVILTQGPDKRWRKLYSSPGIPEFVKTAVKTPDGWPDLQFGGPGFCLPIDRWNGKDYVFNRNHEEQKGACKREG